MMWRRIAEGIAAALQAVVIFVVMTGGHAHPFLCDDNKSQWLPVIDYGMDELVAGRSPSWNPYLFCGIRVDDVGYYGFANPLMIAAHLVARTGVSNTLSLYVFFAFLGGSLFAHGLARRLGSGPVRSGVLVALYQIGFTYWSYGHWYYVFNNFLMCPALLWAVHGYQGAGAELERRRAAWQLGALLGLAIGLGNIQYGLCQWLIVAITLGGPMAWQRRWGEWRDLARIATIAGAIALPTVWMAATAGKYPMQYYGNAASYPVPLWSAVVSNLGLGPLPETHGPGPVSHVGGLAVMLAASLVCLVCCRGPARVNGWAAAIALGLVILFAGGLVIKNVPVFNKFRCAFKWWFLAPPLMLELACLMPRLMPSWRAFDRLAMALALVVGIGQIAPHRPLGMLDPSNGRPASPGYDFSGWDDLAARIDTKNYRVLPVFAGSQMNEFERHDFHGASPFIERQLTANACVRLRAYSGIGYHIGIRNPAVDAVFPLTELLSFPVGAPLTLIEVKHRFPLAEPGNAVAGKPRLVNLMPATDVGVGSRFQLIGPDGETLAENLLLAAHGRIEGHRSMDALLWCAANGELLILGAHRPQSPDWLRRVRASGVRYLILPSDQADDGLEILRSFSFDEPWRLIRGQRYSAIELPTSAPLVSGGDGALVPFVADANGITAFPTSGRSALTIRFNHDPTFIATALSTDGTRVRVPLTATPDGGMHVELPAGNWRQVDVRINDWRLPAAIVLNLVAVGLVGFGWQRTLRGTRSLGAEVEPTAGL